MEIKGKVFPPAQHNHGEHKADALGGHRGHCRTHGPHLQGTHQDQVSHDVEYAGDGDKDKGTFGVPQAPQDAGHHVVPGDENHAQSADEQVVLRLLHSSCGHLHGQHDPRGACGHDH